LRRRAKKALKAYRVNVISESLVIVIGLTVSHYRIVSQIGSGGMGVVYSAEDDRLGRLVALKFVSEELARERQTIERLRSEARTASALNHPGICTIYDIGEYEGRPFIVMELLKGQTLRDRLVHGALKIHEAVDIGIQVADALEAAHSRGIIHRDIKPANLFLIERGHVKILDFGLAKLVARRSMASTTAEGTREKTAEGITLGTVAYMSPEQVTGEELDGRTDLFSLGVVLYEAVTGHQPFTGKTSAVIFSAILTRAPVAPVVFNPDLPLRLQDIINNCLEKDPELRYQDAAGLRADLRRVKRDIESGHSGVVRIGGTTASTATGARPPSGAVHDSHPAHASQPSTEHAAGKRIELATAIASVLIIGVALVGVGSYLPWIRGDKPAETTTAPAPTTTPAATPPESQPAPAPSTPPPSNPAAEAARAIDPSSAPPPAETKSEPARRDSQPRVVPRAAQPPKPPAPAESTKPVAPPARAPEPAAAAPEPSARPEPPPPPAVTPPASATATQSASSTGTASSTPAASTPAAPAPAPSTPPASPPSTPPASAPSSPPATARPAEPTPSRAESAPAESDDAAIRRVVATYARAIESKDLALFRSVKPNLSGAEQRRIEEGFRAVTSQQVEVTILGIEHRGQDAVVRLRRRDTIQASGRQQTTESQQSLTLTRTPSGWVIREIGR
jgi:serine/threonine protein kinase